MLARIINITDVGLADPKSNTKLACGRISTLVTLDWSAKTALWLAQEIATRERVTLTLARAGGTVNSNTCWGSDPPNCPCVCVCVGVSIGVSTEVSIEVSIEVEKSKESRAQHEVCSSNSPSSGERNSSTGIIWLLKSLV